MSRLYLDNAATSFPKPPSVYQAMLRYGTEIGGTAGRGSYFEAREGGRLIRQCRDRINSLIHGEDPDHVIFTLNTTDALNLAVKGVVRHVLMQGHRSGKADFGNQGTTAPEEERVERRGGRRGEASGGTVHLVATVLDHNSVLRPFNALAEETAGSGAGLVEWTCVEVDPEAGVIDPAKVAAAVRAETALVAINHVSNVTGAVQPVQEIVSAVRAAAARLGTKVLVLLDAAQSVGHMAVDIRALDIDLAALPGHKGLLGPLGTGALYIRPGVERVLRPQREGGTGSKSEADRQPDSLPDKYEPGSQNAVGIVGLSEGVKFLLERGERLEAHERELREVMIEGLEELGALGSGKNGLTLIGPRGVEGRTGVFSMIHEALSPQELAAIMEQEHGVLGRAGLACAPRLHGAMGTVAGGGAYRLSVGPFTTVADVRRACEALGAVCRAVVG